MRNQRGKCKDGRCRCRQPAPTQWMRDELLGWLLTAVVAIVAALAGYNLMEMLGRFWIVI